MKKGIFIVLCIIALSYVGDIVFENEATTETKTVQVKADIAMENSAKTL